MDHLGKISVIVPVYNAERFLRRPIDSILGQTYPDLEVILVDDGSQDGSPAICREMEQRDGRVKVITQKNSGVGAARATGLRAVTGDYVMFVDADDYLVPDACERMIRAIQGHDLVISHFFFDAGPISSPMGRIEGDKTIGESEYLEDLLKKPICFYYCSLWNKLYRTDIIRRNGLTFDPFFTWGEDFVFNMQYDQYVHKIALVNEPTYHYVKVIGSASMRWMLHIPHSIRIKYRMYKALRTLYTEKGLYEKNKMKIYWMLFRVSVVE